MSSSKIYLGNLSTSATPEQLEARLKEIFSEYGEIAEVLLPVDRGTGRIKGYGFIGFANETSAQSALARDGETLFDETLTVQIATEKKRASKKS